MRAERKRKSHLGGWLFAVSSCYRRCWIPGGPGRNRTTDTRIFKSGIFKTRAVPGAKGTGIRTSPVNSSKARGLHFHGVESLLCFAERHFHSLDIPRAFDQRFVFPFASGLIRSEEIPAINMYRRCHLADWVQNGMDGIPSKRHSITSPKRPCASCLDAHFFPAPKYVVFSARVNANYRKHLVVVRHEDHIRCPSELENGQVMRPIKRSNTRMPRFAKLCHYFCSIGNCFFHHFANGSLTLDHGSPAILYETIFAEHVDTPYLA